MIAGDSSSLMVNERSGEGVDEAAAQMMNMVDVIQGEKVNSRPPYFNPALLGFYCDASWLSLLLLGPAVASGVDFFEWK